MEYTDQAQSWSAEDHIAMMKELNVSKSILSISSPGTNLKPMDSSACAKMTRSANEELFEVCTANPNYFRFFASLPLPSVPNSLEEIDYALDHLGAVGFVLLSNTNGVYLGDKVLDPVFAKLNERKTIVFMHPTNCNLIISQNSTEETQLVKPLEQFPRPMMEFMFDETRAVANLLLSGTVAKYPHIRFIMSHCGCALPPLLDRFGGFAPLFGARGDQSEEFKTLLRENFFFDLAGFPFPDQIHGLLRTLGERGVQRLLYGSDYCFTPAKTVARLTAMMDKGCEDLFGVEGMKAVYSGNAAELFGISARI
jgi:predicted TIM-barrel fold metal-dependent hydrolase